MNAVDLRRLAERAEGIEGRQGARLTELHGRIRTARRRRTAVGTAAATGLAVVLVSAGVVLNGSIDRTDPPVESPPEPKPTQTGQAQAPEPAGQTTMQAEIGDGDIQGWELMASRTNTDPGHEDATDLSVTAEVGGLYGTLQSFVQPFCNGDPGTWWVLITDLGGVDGEQNADGSLGNGTRGRSGACSEDGPTAVPEPGTAPIPGRQRDEAPEAFPLRMFVTGTLSPAAQQCLDRTTDTNSCLAAHDVAPLDDSDATFGFGVYEHRSGPTVLRVVGWTFQALAIGGGVEYLVDRAVVAAPDAARLVVQLPASDHHTAMAVYYSDTAAIEDCFAQIDIEVVDPASERAYFEAMDQRCRPTLELRVDGQPAAQNVGSDSYFGDQQVILPPGDAREVTVDVVKNDPANIRYALVIWEERS